MGIILFFICLILVILICIIISIKNDEKNGKEYCAQYISQIVLSDGFFGEMEFEEDKKLNIITCRNHNVQFGKYSPIISIENYEEKNKEMYFSCLETVYEKQEEIIQNLLNGFLNSNSNGDERIREKLEEIFLIESIAIERRGEYFLEDTVYMDTCCEIIESNPLEFDMDGDQNDLVISVVGNSNKSKDHNYYQMPVAYMDCKTKSMCYIFME